VIFGSRLRAPEDVLVSHLDGGSVILNLKTESYFGLDYTGTRMWAAVTSVDTVQEAYDALANEFDVDPAILREDLLKILDNLLEHGLLEVQT